MADSGKTEALLKWLSTFGIETRSPDQVSDGVAMAKALHMIDSNHFGQDFLAKIKMDIPSNNKHLKAGNLRKVLGGIVEYNNEVIGLQLNDFPMPNVNKAADGHNEETGRLLQLILGCAVNCDHKQGYIEAIMNLEESVQQIIMQAIQELLNLRSPSSMPTMTPSDIRKIMDDLEASNQEREELRQKCHELESQVKLLAEDKSNLSAEFENLQAQVLGKADRHGASDSSGADTGFKLKEMKKQLETTQEDLYKMEKERDDLAVKLEDLEKNLEESTAKEAELQGLADQARQLKDEVDILRETADKVAKYEASIESYKKKMEELADLKRQVKLLEDKNTTLMQANIGLEDDVKKTGNWKPQIDAYKKQIAELQSKLDKETKKADKVDFDNKRLVEKLEAVTVERDRIKSERDDLREKNSEMQDQMNVPSGVSQGGGLGLLSASGANDSDMLEMIPPTIKERLLRLQHENKRLKEQAAGGGGPAHPVLQTMVDDLKEREAKLEGENRNLNQQIMELQSRLEDSAKSAAAGGGNVPRVPGSREELELKLSESNKKIGHLNETLTKKDAEIQRMEELYKKHIEKAKSVIKTLDPRNNPNAGGGLEVLRSQLNEKDRLIETLEQETEKARAVREMEERLISSAFYNLSMHMHRSTVETRLSNVHSTASTHGQSFLARQRQVPTSTGAGSRPASNKSNRGSNDFLDY